MPNPFTRFLQQWVDDRRLNILLEHCDALEALVIRVYKRGAATPPDEAEYQALRRWLSANHDQWAPLLAPYWEQVGLQAGEDGLHYLIHAPAASAFVENWGAMQALPAVREALNRLVLELGNEEEK